MTQEDLLDRLAHVEDLATRSADPQLTEAYGLVAKAVLAAPPREITEREVARLHVQALRTKDPRRAAALRQSANDLAVKCPSAPRRADVVKARSAARGSQSVQEAVTSMIAKAEAAVAPVSIAKAKAKEDAALKVPMYNQAGELIGIVDPDAIQPLAAPKAAAGKPADATPAPAAEAGTPAGGVANARDGQPEAPPSAAVVKSAFRNAGTTAEQNAAFAELNAAAVRGLDMIHGRRARPGR